MRCVSSFFLTALPRLFAASRISAANRSVIVFSPRPRAYETIQRIASAPRRSSDLSNASIGTQLDAARNDLKALELQLTTEHPDVVRARRKITELEWPAMLRMLDRRDASYRE